MDPNYQLECLAYEQSIDLAKLEEARAHIRVQELAYEYARYKLDYQRHEAARNESYRQMPPPGVAANA